MLPSLFCICIRILLCVDCPICPVCILVRLLIVSPASSVKAESSSSALRRLITWLRTTMMETHLNSVTVRHILGKTPEPHPRRAPRRTRQGRGVSNAGRGFYPPQQPGAAPLKNIPSPLFSKFFSNINQACNASLHTQRSSDLQV